MELLEFEKPIAELEKELELLQNKSRSQDIDLSSEILAIEGKLIETRREIYQNLSPWQRVQIARHTKDNPDKDQYYQIAENYDGSLHGKSTEINEDNISNYDLTIYN